MHKRRRGAHASTGRARSSSSRAERWRIASIGLGLEHPMACGGVCARCGGAYLDPAMQGLLPPQRMGTPLRASARHRQPQHMHFSVTRQATDARAGNGMSARAQPVCYILLALRRVYATARQSGMAVQPGSAPADADDGVDGEPNLRGTCSHVVSTPVQSHSPLCLQGSKAQISQRTVTGSPRRLNHTVCHIGRHSAPRA